LCCIGFKNIAVVCSCVYLADCVGLKFDCRSVDDACLLAPACPDASFCYCPALLCSLCCYPQPPLITLLRNRTRWSMRTWLRWCPRKSPARPLRLAVGFSGLKICADTSTCICPALSCCVPCDPIHSPTLLTRTRWSMRTR
jgi:hypothetical protein